MNLSARFNQSPAEKKRYLLDYTLQLAAGEIITGIVVAISSPTDGVNAGAFAITGVAIAPGNLQAAYFAAGGLDQTTYNVQFIATTSVGQRLEDIVEYNLREKTDP